MSKNCYKINIYLLFHLLKIIKKVRTNNNIELKIKKIYKIIIKYNIKYNIIYNIKYNI